jgi:putative transposase
MTTMIKQELLDDLLSGVSSPDDLLGDEGLFRQLKKALMERVLEGELTHHLGYSKGDVAGRKTGNSRNGHSKKTVLGEDGEIDLAIPRDRTGTFEPKLIPKGERRLDGFDGKVISLYARGLTVREIRGHLHEIYGVEVSPDLISRVTDAVLEEVKEWQSRPLDPVYPIVFFDALRVKVRDEGTVKNKAVYVALAHDMEGQKHVLGLWIEQNEGAKFWLKVMNDLKVRGVNDILIAAVDGLKGFPEAIGAVFPEAMVQTCIVHLIRSSMAYVSWKDRKAIIPDLKAIYRAENAEAALDRLADFEAIWGQRYPTVLLPARGSPDDLYDQRRGEPQPIAAQDHQDAGKLSQRRCRDEAFVSGDQQCGHPLEKTDCMDRRNEPVCHPVWRPIYGLS